MSALYIISWAQNSGAVGNGVHFFLKSDSKIEFDAESDGADRFLKKGAQSAHLGQTGAQTDFEAILANFTRY